MTFKSMDELKLVLGGDTATLIQQHFPELLTHSSLQMFQSCEQRWFFRYILGLTRRRTPKPLIVGRLMHLGMETVLKARVSGASDPLDAGKTFDLDETIGQLDSLFDREIDSIAEKSDMLGANDSEALEYCRVQALAMVEAWCRLSMERLVTEWEPVAVEHRIRLPKWAGWTMSGKIDGIVRSKRTSRLYVLEHKSRSRMDTLSTTTLSLDQQANFYMDAYEAETGQTVDGFLYDVVQKPLHRMSAKGSDDLRRRMVDAMMDDPDKYCCLVDVLAGRGDRKRNLDNMREIAGRMKVSTPSTILMNTGACDSYSGCSYKSLCQNGACARCPKSIASCQSLHEYALLPPNTELDESEASDE